MKCRNVVFYDEQRDFFFGDVQVLSESQLAQLKVSDSASDGTPETTYSIEETE